MQMYEMVSVCVSECVSVCVCVCVVKGCDSLLARVGVIVIVAVLCQ